MALLPNRHIEVSDFFQLNDVASAGVGLCYSTANSGVVLGDHINLVQLAANPSGLKFAGILIPEVVNLDLTRYHLNWHKNQHQVNDAVEVMRRGYVYTNKLAVTTMTLGDKAYLTSNGQFTQTVSSTGGVAQTPYAGEFGGKADELGYVKISINLPQDIK